MPHIMCEDGDRRLMQLSHAVVVVAVVVGFLSVCTLLPLAGNSSRLTWVSLQLPQEQRYPH